MLDHLALHAISYFKSNSVPLMKCALQPVIILFYLNLCSLFVWVLGAKAQYSSLNVCQNRLSARSCMCLSARSSSTKFLSFLLQWQTWLDSVFCIWLVSILQRSRSLWVDLWETKI